MKSMRLMVVEDGKSQREMLSGFLRGEGHNVLEAEDGPDGLALLKENYIDLMLLDYKMPGMDGMEVLEKAKEITPEIDVIMMTAYGTVETAVNAMKAGAADYLTKPVDLEEVRILLHRLGEHRLLMKENRVLKEELRSRGITADKIIYRSTAMEEVINMIGRVATSRAAVLLQGESGTGKELLARLLHTLSPRSEEPLVIVNCAALPETLLESELFGHEKGAFTGATSSRMGRFEEADGGTLFLDEIGELSATVQVKLLRFLQEHEFQRVGGNRTLSSDVRVISATNKDLAEKVREGAFRDDLFYRLNVVPITVPRLRERKEDVVPLVDHFIGKFAAENAKPVNGIEPQARDLLLKYDFPGNVRELENIIERAVVITRSSLIGIDDLPFGGEQATEDDAVPSGEGTGLRDEVEKLEIRMIRKAINESGRNQSQAAELLGISERMLRYKLKKYKLK
ncbi:MAG TPA: sigma-54-dependent Fis family transcriptional regulator [Desulfobacteraceae bacterium]|nr:sigma-54-dependent Fis family transcriptional regulator [Desulfobacteraceae bacterium]